jgi:glycerophosphoryl diester phosphodiesterase
MTLLRFALLPLLVLFTGPNTFAQPMPATKLDIQGHRGCRGLLPENTLPAFIKALDLGVTTLELDLAVSRDGQLVVSHEPYLSPKICKGPNGESVTPANQKQFNLYQMDYAEIAKCDCGSRGNVDFPEQQKMAAYKPLLATVIDEVEKYVAEKKLPLPYYNIEIKSEPKTDSTYHPAPPQFSELVYQLLKAKGLLRRANVQSFDGRILQWLHQHRPDVRLAYLVFGQANFEKNLADLGFIPETYSPHFMLVNPALLSYAAQKGFKVIPWTVNELDKMRELQQMGVHGLITDYPDRAKQLAQH